MPITKITINSKESVRAIKFYKIMTKFMDFSSTMESVNWVKSRRILKFFYKAMPVEKNVVFDNVNLGEIPAMVSTYTKESPREDLIYFYIHGGGFVTGSAFIGKAYCSCLARYSGCRVYSPEYRLAPEFPYPAGFNDCCHAFEALMDKYPEAKFAVLGESAGGNLGAGLTLKYKDTGRICSLSAHSATMDLSGKLDHKKIENKDFVVKPGCEGPISRMYVRWKDATAPFISPIYGDFDGFPPTFISCDANETLNEDSKALYRKCKEAGTPVSLTEFTGSYHAIGISGIAMPETKQLLLDNIDFINNSIVGEQ